LLNINSFKTENLREINMLLCIIKSIFLWLSSLLVVQTLVGMIIRGLIWSPPDFEGASTRVYKMLQRESRKSSFANITMNVLSIIFVAAFFYALYHFFNIGIVLSIGLLLVSCLPDMLWKIRTGSTENMPKNVFYISANLLTLISLPLTWFFLCKYNL